MPLRPDPLKDDARPSGTEQGAATRPNGERYAAFRFGAFSVVPARRMLLEGDRPIRVGGRAFDILVLLLRRAGEFVRNEEIARQVWPQSVVVEGNLRVHVADLRKALGDGQGGRRYIINVPNRGYCFVEPVEHQEATAPADQEPVVGLASGRRAHLARLPAPLGRIIGQELALRTLEGHVATRRLVTLVGAGGIGKTTLALVLASAAQHDAKRWPEVHFVDLSTLADAELVPGSTAVALGLGPRADDATPSVVAFLQDRSALIVIDNCEHLLDAVAPLVEQILRAAPGVHILATSREPLRAEGEWVQRLYPLTFPDESRELRAHDAVTYPAVELFVERASAARGSFELSDDDVPAIVSICRRLDGLPLAIELAAARVASFGVRAIDAALKDGFALLGKGRRTALPRHQTLSATQDWSFRLLSAPEQTLRERPAIPSVRRTVTP